MATVVHLVHRTQTSLRSVRAVGLGFTAKAHARSEANWLGKKNLESRVRGDFNFQRDDAPASGRIRWPQSRWLAGLAPFQLPR